MAQLKKTMFREYDIRGRVSDEELNEPNCELIGKGFGTFLRRINIEEAVVGFDAREYSQRLKNALVEGIISTGVNGTPEGFHNCSDLFSERSDEHTAWSNAHEIHAEMNCLLFAAGHGISTEGTTLYCTTEPCGPCLKNLIQSIPQ